MMSKKRNLFSFWVELKNPGIPPSAARLTSRSEKRLLLSTAARKKDAAVMCRVTLRRLSPKCLNAHGGATGSHKYQVHITQPSVWRCVA